jgi:hypothetical protein
MSGQAGQRPCLHAEVPAFAETLRAGRRYGTQAWSPAAGMESVFNFERTNKKGSPSTMKVSPELELLEVPFPLFLPIYQLHILS